MDNKKDELKVAWLGIDGALILLYVVLAIVYGYGIINKIDFIVGIMAPGVAIVITVGVFIQYCAEIFAFTIGKKGKN